MLYEYCGTVYLNTPSTLDGYSCTHETFTLLVFLLNL
nr:MAG TPA: hypothetical protein [Crassvirales sp.]